MNMNYEQFNYFLTMSGKKVSDVCKATGIAPSTFSDWKKGRYTPKSDKIDSIIEYFYSLPNSGIRLYFENLNVDKESQANRLTHYESILASLNRNSSVSIPVLNTVIAGQPVSAYEDILEYEEISADLAATGEFFALKIKGSSMMPTLQENDIIIVKQTSDVDTGDIAIVLINGDEATVKKVVKSPDGITLVAFNPAVYEPHFYSNDDINKLPIRIIGKVMEMKRTF